MTRSQPLPPNPCSPDPRLPNSPRPLKTPRTTPLPQSPGSSIAHLRNQDRTPPLVRPQPPAKTPITVHPITTTPNPHTRTHIHPKHIASSIDNTPTPTTSPSLVRPNINRATTKKTTHRRNHPYSRFTHNLNFNSPHASTCHMCPDTTVTIPPHPDMTPPPFLVSNPIHDSPPFNLDSHSDFPSILPSSSTTNVPQPTLPNFNIFPSITREPETNRNPNPNVDRNSHPPDVLYSPSPTIDPSLPCNYPILPIPTTCTFEFTHSHPFLDLDAHMC